MISEKVKSALSDAEAARSAAERAKASVEDALAEMAQMPARPEMTEEEKADWKRTGDLLASAKSYCFSAYSAADNATSNLGACAEVMAKYEP